MLHTVIRILIGLIFIFSGIVKLYPIETFELTFVDIHVANWVTAPFIARLFIAFEIILGTLLALGIRLKKIILLSIVTLVILSIYIIFLWIDKGNEVNCGCFGSYLYLTPTESLLKNIILIAFLLVTLKNIHQQKVLRLKPVYLIISILLLTALPFILNPINFSSPAPDEENVSIPLKTELIAPLIYNNDTINLKQGKFLLLIASATCPHCKTMAYKLDIFKQSEKLENVYIIFKGKPETTEINQFFKDSNSSLPYTYLNDYYVFDLTRGIFPSILLINNGVIVKYWNAKTLSPEKLEYIASELKKEP